MKIREIREARGMSQADISRATGLNQSSICRLEKGELNPTLATVREIAQALDCTVGELLGETATKPARRRAGSPS